MQPAVSLPKSEFVLPEKKAEFADINEKGAYINSVMDISYKAILAADKFYN
jgi:hypothetical protein